MEHFSIPNVEKRVDVILLGVFRPMLNDQLDECSFHMKIKSVLAELAIKNRIGFQVSRTSSEILNITQEGCFTSEDFTTVVIIQGVALYRQKQKYC
jgi:hypothetical protein